MKRKSKIRHFDSITFSYIFNLNDTFRKEVYLWLEVQDWKAGSKTN